MHTWRFLMGLAAWLVAGSAAAETTPLLLHNWSNYTPASLLQAFTAQTGVPVKLSNYESNEELENTLQTGQAYDLVVPSAKPFFARQLAAGLYQPLDLSAIRGYEQLDVGLMRQLSSADPGNRHGIVYAWGTIGLGLNLKKIKEVSADAPRDSWRLIFDPAFARSLAKCGIAVMDSPGEVVPLLLNYLGYDPNSQDPASLQLALKQLGQLTGLWNVTSGSTADLLASGKACVVIGYSGDLLRIAASNPDLTYVLPKEGSQLWIDALAIPGSAPNPAAAYQFISFMLQPAEAAKITNEYFFATGVREAWSFVRPELRNNPNIFPDAAKREKLFVLQRSQPSWQRQLERGWQQWRASKPSAPASAAPAAKP